MRRLEGCFVPKVQDLKGALRGAPRRSKRKTTAPIAALGGSWVIATNWGGLRIEGGRGGFTQGVRGRENA